MVWEGIATWPTERMAVVGSSLGGFYATCVAARLGCKAVLLNPAVFPARDLARHIGEHPQWHDPSQRLYFAPEYVDELRVLEREAAATPLDPTRVYAVIAEGDEVLDWREMAGRYAGATIRLLAGGDHAISDFETDHLQGVLDFLRLA